MESKEQIIQRVASSLGFSFEHVEAMMYKGCDTSEILIDKIEELKQAMERLGHGPIPHKRRKPTNYTKPRNRKKKHKNKR